MGASWVLSSETILTGRSVSRFKVKFCHRTSSCHNSSLSTPLLLPLILTRACSFLWYTRSLLFFSPLKLLPLQNLSHSLRILLHLKMNHIKVAPKIFHSSYIVWTRNPCSKLYTLFWHKKLRLLFTIWWEN